MNIRNKWRMLGLNQKVWISLAGALTLLAVAIGCFKLVEPQTWYRASPVTGTCINARLEAKELGDPQLASPYKLGSWDQKHHDGYTGTSTIHLRGDEGVMAMVVNSANVRAYFSKKRMCITYVEHMGG